MINSYTSDNASFFSNPFSFAVDLKPIVYWFAKQAGAVTIDAYLKALQEHIAHLSSYVEEYTELGAFNTYLSFHNDGEEPVLYFHGQIPWSKEEIDQFQQATNSKESDLDRLKNLIAKYPDQATEMLAKKEQWSLIVSKT